MDHATLHLDDLIDRFEQCWQCGRPEEIEQILTPTVSDPALRRAALLELIAVDMEYRWRATSDSAEPGGESLRCVFRLEDYVSQWPELGLPSELPLELIAEEFRIRHRWGDQPDIAAYQQRFPNPRLRETLERMQRELAQEAPAAAQEASTPEREIANLKSPTPPETPRLDVAGSYAETLSMVTGDISIPRAPTPTTTSWGPYDLLAVLGQGGMGTVYHAYHPQTDRQVALKVIRGDRLPPLDSPERDELLARFQQEVQAAARLEHDHIVRVYEVGQQGDQPYFSMQYVAGTNLHQQLLDGPRPDREAADTLLPVVRAIESAHAHGVVHRDIKPHNILLDDAGRPWVSDFGLAKCLDYEGVETRTGMILGTPPYMSPEQARGSRHVDASTDVYALGATLYELLTGRPPFRAATPVETLRLVLETDPVPPRRMNPAISRDLETICLKCLEKEPSARYGSARELADELDRFLDGSPIQARPVSTVERGVRWCRRNPARAGAWLASICVVLLAMASAFWFRSLRLERTIRTQAEVAGALAAAQQFEQQSQLVPDQELTLLREALSAAMRARAALATGEGNAHLNQISLATVEDYEQRIEKLEREAQREQTDSTMLVRLREARLAAARKAIEFDDIVIVYKPMREPPDDADRLYQEAFTEYGIDLLTLSPEVASDRIQQSEIRSQLLTAIDDWAITSAKRRPLLWATANRADDSKVRIAYRTAFLNGRYDRCTAAAKEDASHLGPALVITLSQIYEQILPGPSGSDAAIVLLDQFQAHYPNDYAINCWLGRCWDRKGDFQRSELYYMVAAAIEPSVPEIHFKLAVIANKQRKLPQGAAHMREAARLAPERVEMQLEYAIYLLPVDDHQAAVELRRVLEMDPEQEEAHFYLGRYLLKRSAYAEALRHFEISHRLGSKYENWPHSTAEWVDRTRRLATLAAELTAFEETGALPDDPLRCGELGQFTAYRLNRYQPAMAICARSLELDGDPPRRTLLLQAAMVSVMAAAREEDATDEARNGYRRQAGNWLAAAITSFEQNLNQDPKLADEIKSLIESIKGDADFNSLRESGLRRLPPELQRQWGDIWKRLDALSTRSIENARQPPAVKLYALQLVPLLTLAGRAAIAQRIASKVWEWASKHFANLRTRSRTSSSALP